MEFRRKKYVRMLALRKKNGLIKVITGARRSGKSYILNELYYHHLRGEGVEPAHIIRFAFDSDEDIDKLEDFFPDEPTRIKDGNDYKVSAKKFRAYIAACINERDDFYLLLDEVQLLEHFVGTLNSYLRHKNLDIYVTGSNSKFLSTDIATEFKGRSSEVHVFPLSFSEYYAARSWSAEEAWREYLVTGGLPIVAVMQNEDERVSYLQNLCTEMYLKDIIQRNDIRKSTELADTFSLLASMIGTPLNPLKLTHTFQSLRHKDITNDTIAKFVRYFEEAFVICKAKKFNIKGKKHIDSPFKIYFEDVGVRNAQLDFRQVEETHLLENIIFNELRYRGYRVEVGQMDVSEKTDRIDANGKAIYAQKSLEVDFIATRGNQKIYLQSALSVSDPEKAAQEKRSLYAINDSFEKIIVSKNGLKPTRDEKGVLTMDVFDFLLGEEEA